MISNSTINNAMIQKIINLKSLKEKSVIINSNMNYSEIEASLTNCIYGV